MSKKQSYSDKLKHPKWQRKRLEIMKRDKFQCKKCGDEETTLHIHHKIYKQGSEPWEYHNNELVTLCEDCHFIIENYRDEFDMSEIRISRLNNWADDSKIIFISTNELLNMEIYDKDNNWMCGYKMNEATIREIRKIINHTLKKC